ncbi:MAG: hypothetical protein H0U95_16820 [Bacteroidetes bacterium]|nr:hypothetical protein [Bacteroidota bacterium]
MKIIIIGSLGLITQLAHSQVQQQQAFFANNISNINSQSRGNVFNDNVSNNLSNLNVRLNNTVVHRQQVKRNIVKATPAQKNTQLKTIITNKTPVTPSVRRRPRTTPVVQANVKVTEILTASHSNPEVLGNLYNPQVQTINFINNDDIQSINAPNTQSQGGNSYNQQDVSNLGSQINFNVDLSVSLRGRSFTRSSGSSSSHSTAHIFSKKFAKFKRHFFGKMTLHKKSKHRLDVCFSWKN